jgi:hypothetical protein
MVPVESEERTTPATENVFLHAEAKAVETLRADTIYQASLFVEGGNQ